MSTMNSETRQLLQQLNEVENSRRLEELKIVEERLRFAKTQSELKTYRSELQKEEAKRKGLEEKMKMLQNEEEEFKQSETSINLSYEQLKEEFDMASQCHREKMAVLDRERYAVLILQILRFSMCMRVIYYMFRSELEQKICKIKEFSEKKISEGLSCHGMQQNQSKVGLIIDSRVVSDTDAKTGDLQRVDLQMQRADDDLQVSQRQKLEMEKESLRNEISSLLKNQSAKEQEGSMSLEELRSNLRELEELIASLNHVKMKKLCPNCIMIDDPVNK